MRESQEVKTQNGIGGKEHVLREKTETKLLGLLGFAARARKLVCGADLCRDEVRRGTVRLVLVAADASSNTKKRMNDACNYYKIDLCQVPLTATVLAKQIGKTSDIAVIGVTDPHFADGIFALFDK